MKRGWGLFRNGYKQAAYEAHITDLDHLEKILTLFGDTIEKTVLLEWLKQTRQDLEDCYR